MNEESKAAIGLDEKAIELHRKARGKIELRSKVPLEGRDDLSVAYTPGVAAVSRAIAENPERMYELTGKGNSVAVVSDGSAVLGLGNIGPAGAYPVMEGKCVLFKKFAGIDAYPLVLGTQNADEIVETIVNLQEGFGGINLEDISAPRCFEIEEGLRAELSIPAFHADQHGTAITVLAGLINALKVVGKGGEEKRAEVKIVINGAGAAGYAIAALLAEYGFKRLTVVDSVGAICEGRTENMNATKEKI